MFNIAKKVIDINIRSSKFVLFNALFPMLLIVMIGYMMSGELGNEKNIDEVIVSYYDNGSEKSSMVLDSILENSFDMNIKLKEINSVEEGKQSARLNESVFVYLDKDDINIYGNDNSSIDKAVVNSIFNSVNNKINTMNIIYNENPQYSPDLINDTLTENINIEKISSKEAPTSFDYYGVVEITMISMYVACYPIYSMRSERQYKLKERIKLANISNIQYYLGSFLGFVVLGAISTLPGYIFAIAIVKINIGTNVVLPYILILSLSTMFVTVGMLIECICKDTDKASALLQAIVFPILSFLGGCYINLPDDVGGLFQVATNLSPLRWVNRSIFKMIYDGDYKMFMASMLANILIIIVILSIVLIITKKEEEIA